jgi:hypothetical protein
VPGAQRIEGPFHFEPVDIFAREHVLRPVVAARDHIRSGDAEAQNQRLAGKPLANPPLSTQPQRGVLRACARMARPVASSHPESKQCEEEDLNLHVLSDTRT